MVVGLDLSDYSDIVLEHAIDQAARHDHPELHFITVIDRARSEERAQEQQMDDAKSRLGALVMPLLSDLAKVEWQARLHVRRGVVEEEIANLAAELRADLVVVGRFGLHHRRGHRALGSIAGRVLALVYVPDARRWHGRHSPRCDAELRRLRGDPSTVRW